MRIAFRGGHNRQSPGCTGLIDEVTEDRLILAECLRLAKAAGHEVLDCTPGNCGVNEDLAFGVNKANSWKADVFVPIHLNKCYPSYEGKIGAEVLVYNYNDYGRRIIKNLSDLGFKNRGQKVRKELYDLRATNMTACIVEVCFVEATEDVKLYKSLGVSSIAKAIVEGIIGKSLDQNANKPISEEKAPIVDSSNAKKHSWHFRYDPWVKKLQMYLNDRGHNVLIDGKAGEQTYGAIRGYSLSLNERATLAKLVQERLNSKGYNSGAVDGIVGPITYGAINRFQRDNGLKVGRLEHDNWKYLII